MLRMAAIGIVATSVVLLLYPCFSKAYVANSSATLHRAMRRSMTPRDRSKTPVVKASTESSENNRLRVSEQVCKTRSVDESLSRRNLLEKCASAGFRVGAVSVGSWCAGSEKGVLSAAAFGGPSRPLLRCLVNTINAREFSRNLEADLAAGVNEQECRGLVKAILRGLDLQGCLKDAVLYLPAGKRQAATDVGQSAVEYLATVVEFDAWDKLDKDWTSNVALRNMTPDNVKFVRMALDAARSSLDQFLRKFDRGDVEAAEETYRSLHPPAENEE